MSENSDKGFPFANPLGSSLCIIVYLFFIFDSLLLLTFIAVNHIIYMTVWSYIIKGDMVMFDKKYNDNYKTSTAEIMGTTWEFAEFEHHIIKNQRKNLGLTQQEVADRAHIQLRQYQRLESGERSIYSASFRVAIAVCKALNLDPQRFIDCL